MSDIDFSVTTLIRRIKENDGSAANQLCRQFFDRLACFADGKLAGIRHHVEGGDIAVSCLDLLCRKLGEGRYPDLSQSSELWSLLVRMAEQKALDRRKLVLAKKRGGGEVRGDSVFIASGRGISEHVADIGQPTAEDVVDLQDAFQALMKRLPSEELRQTVLARLAGESTESIAARLGASKRSVQLRLKSIAEEWEEAITG
jgi:DNA-directed RNA polymerase specialized sigma24 family protein